jgi:peptidoglycan/xylan/chitin deacetylase (PgdA/CDA1 family)
MKVRNYLFHRVSPERDRLWDPMDPSHFEKCIKYIQKKYTVLSLEELYLSGNINESGKPIATICFDDGFKDNIEFAVPILKKYNCPASFYVVTDCVSDNTPTWTYVLDYLFLNTEKLELVIRSSETPIQFNNLHWKSNIEREDFNKKFKPFLKGLNNIKRLEVLKEIKAQFNDVQVPQIMMSWDDVRSLIKDGFTVGSHTVSHPLLATLDNEALIKEELFESAKKIRLETGQFPISISYPIGSYNREVINLSKDVGYKLGLAVKQRFYDKNKDGLFDIPRVELYNESWFKTKLRITGKLELIKKTLRK